MNITGKLNEGHSTPSTYHRRALIVIVAILLIAALLRVAHLSYVPLGFSPDEIANIQVSETIRRMGTVASFYNVPDSAGSHEGLYPMIQAVTTNVLGSGLFCFRILPTWLGLLSIALAYALARRLFGTFAGLVAALTLATTFYPILLSRSTARETLLLPLLLALLFLLAQALHVRGEEVRPQPLRTVPFIALGLLVAGLAYTQWTGLIAAPIILVVILYLRRTRQPISRRVTSLTTFGLVVALILGIPYLTFTLRLPSLSGLYIYWANRPTSLGGLIASLSQTLVSLFYRGDLSPQHNLPGNPLLGPLGAILLVIGFVVAIRRWRSPNMGFILIALLFALFPAVWSRASANGVNDTNLVVALPALSALVGLGATILLAWFSKRQTSPRLEHGLALSALLVVGVISAGLAAFMLFGLWQADPQVDVAYRQQFGRIMVYLANVNDGLVTDICSFNLDNGQNGRTTISDPALFDLMLHRSVSNIRFSDCLTGFVLVNGGSPQRVAYADPGQEAQISGAFSSWLSQATPVLDPKLTPGSVVQIGVESQLADVLGKLTEGHVSWSPGTTGPTQSSAAPLPVRMGGYLTFVGYAYDKTQVYKPGATLTVVTYWRADGDQIPDLRIFMHVLPDPNAAPVAQDDILSIDPTLLKTRDIFIQVFSIPLPASMSQGDYYVSVGAYGAATKERLPVFDDEEPRGDRLFLDSIKVQP